MTETDVKQIVDALKQSQSKDSDKSKMIEWLFRLLLGVIVWIGLGLKNDVDTLKKDVSTIITQRTYSEVEITNLKDFLKKPRFTREDYENLIIPIKSSVNKNELELKSRVAFMDQTQTRILKLEYEMQQLRGKK
tara:strand:+ start:1267 stop:1668 length:402 start_codon:yes stop_codon:yes gene_type:complete